MVAVVRHVIMLLFADDLKALKLVANLNEARKLQEDINNVVVWCIDNRLLLYKQNGAVFTASGSRSVVETN